MLVDWWKIIILITAVEMHQDESQLGKKAVHTENADIEYILDLFDNKELGLTITEDREEN